jgi:hypothetical protein
MKYFVDVIAKQVIERHLVANLPNILSPIIMAHFTDKDIQYLAGELQNVTQLREHLLGKKDMLEEGQNAFNSAMGVVN